MGASRWLEAEPLLTKGYQGMKEQEDKIPPQVKVRLSEAMERLVQLHEATGNQQEAARWRKALEQEREALKKGQRPAGDTQPKDGKQDAARR